MKLHANAALSLKGRRQLCSRVVDEQWTVSEAAEAAEVSVRCARKWVGRYRRTGSSGCVIAPRRRGRFRIAPTSVGSKSLPRCAGCG